MSKLQIELLVAAVISLFVILFFLKKNRINVKYTVMWLLLPIIFILMLIFPNGIDGLSKFLGFELASNFVFFITLAVVILFCFGLTIIVSKQKKQITKLIQEIAILRREFDEKQKKH